ncbi:MAG: dicarboxylate/amino acid:cation symporter [Bacteroidaceae bacterium]|nr:dicarboxylate/amino acid:cation symporter [Bacteroidaceae bacterium]
MKTTNIRISFTAQILISLLLAIIVGAMMTDEVQFAESYIQPFGVIFLNLLKFIVAPLVLLSIMNGLLSMDDVTKIGKLSVKTLLAFTTTTVIAVTLGLVLGTVMQDHFPVIDIPASAEVTVIDRSFMDQIVNIFPSNIIVPLLNSEMMQIIFIAVVFAIAIVHIGEKGNLLREFTQSAGEAVTKVLGYFMAVAPIGIFCMLTPVVASNGVNVLGVYAVLLGADYACFLLHTLLVYVPLVYFVGRCNPLRFFREMTPAILFAFSSDSGVATLPYTMKSCEKLGVRKDIGSFILSLGATIHMDGVAIYLGLSSVFIAACCGIDLSFQQYIAIAVSSTLASVGTPGIPGGSLALMAMVFSSAGLPVEGVALIAGIDRIVDMGRTVMSITGDAACAVAIQRFEGCSINSPQK